MPLTFYLEINNLLGEKQMFVDYRKTFDMVDQGSLLQKLLTIGIDSKIRRIIYMYKMLNHVSSKIVHTQIFAWLPKLTALYYVNS